MGKSNSTPHSCCRLLLESSPCYITTGQVLTPLVYTFPWLLVCTDSSMSNIFVQKKHSLSYPVSFRPLHLQYSFPEHTFFFAKLKRSHRLASIITTTSCNTTIRHPRKITRKYQQNCSYTCRPNGGRISSDDVIARPCCCRYRKLPLSCVFLIIQRILFLFLCDFTKKAQVKAKTWTE